MNIWVHSNASYLCEFRARPRAGTYIYLGNKPKFPILPDSFPPKHNAPMDIICKIMDNIMLSAQEEETCAG